MKSLTLLPTLTASLLIAIHAPTAAAEKGTPKHFDAAPFGFTEISSDGRAYEVRWAKARKIRQVVVEFGKNDKLPDPISVRLQYWLSSWDGKADVVYTESAIYSGWRKMDDWTNGKWQDADTSLKIDGRRWTFTFAPSGDKEFEGLGESSVNYRKTIKVRLLAEKRLPKPAAFRALTESIRRPLGVRVLWGKPATEAIKIGDNDSCRLDVFNGTATAVREMRGSNFTVDDKKQWTLPETVEGGMEIDLDTARDRINKDYDRTIVTIRSKYRPFSFAANDIAAGRRVLVDDLGVLVTAADDPITLEEYRKEIKRQPGRSIYDMVFEESEQTLQKAWDDMPIKFPLWFVHGLPGNRNAVKHNPNGNIDISSVRQWFNVDRSPRDSDRKDWNGNFLSLNFGFPDDSLRAGRELRDGYLPLLRTWWVDGTIYYEQLAILDKLDGDLSQFRLDDPTLLLMKVRVVNTSGDKSGTARLSLTSGNDKLALDGERMMTRDKDKPRLRYIVKNTSPGKTSQGERGVDWSLDLKPGESHELFFAIPTVTSTDKKEIEQLRNRDFDEASGRLCDMWKKLADHGTQINTPEPWLNHFYRAHIRHLEVNCVKDIKKSWRYARVGTFSYAVFPNESVMMTGDLGRRGHHKLVEDCMDGWLPYQGSVMLPGNFKSAEGQLFGSGGWQHIGYNKHHGCIMWGLADHWRMTRDRKWMERVAPKLVKACDWVTRERKATMKLNPDGSRPLEYGFLPAGGLEDVQDYWYWVATNTGTVWGFDALADALADYGHPEGQRLVKEAKAYHDDVLHGITEARILTPVVGLRDGTYVPKFPSRLYERGRSLGWIRETLEGSLYLIYNGLVAADSPEATWILKDHEDNLFVSDTYGYSIPNFKMFWFSRGGFSMQSNLLEGPACYLMRDDIKHFVRGYFNGFASAFYPGIMMCNEHCRPELGYPSGDHFKSSDEANVTTWLRLMFILEDGQDLYLAKGIPRYWLAGGKTISIKNAATYFGPMSLEITSAKDHKTITAVLDPPKRNPPKSIRLRIRHPDSKPIKSVTINGKKHGRFDPKKEWIEIQPDAREVQNVVVSY